MSTQSEIVRYDLVTNIHGGDIREIENGDLVLYTDHLTARAADTAEIERLRAETRHIRMALVSQLRDIERRIGVAASPEWVKGELDELANRVEFQLSHDAALKRDIASKAEAAAKEIFEKRLGMLIHSRSSRVIQELTAIITRTFEAKQ